MPDSVVDEDEQTAADAGSSGRAVITDGARRMDAGWPTVGKAGCPSIVVEAADRPSGIVCGTYHLLAGHVRPSDAGRSIGRSAYARACRIVTRWDDAVLGHLAAG